MSAASEPIASSVYRIGMYHIRATGPVTLASVAHFIFFQAAGVSYGESDTVAAEFIEKALAVGDIEVYDDDENPPAYIAKES